MKTHNIFLGIIILAMLVLSACREVTITTKVNSDGSFTRIMTVTGDSADVFNTDLPFPVDGTWSAVSSKDTADSTKYMRIYTKSFRNIAEFNAELKNTTGDYKNLDREVSITKKFRFFFSYLTFREVYKCVNPFRMLDYHDYLTEDDIRLYTGTMTPATAADSTVKDKALDKAMNFLIESATFEAETIVKNGIKQLGNPALNSIDLSMYHDSINYLITKSDQDKTPDIIDSYQRWSGNEAFSLLHGIKPPLFDDFQKKIAVMDTILKAEGYTEDVEMPGLITGTNSTMLKGNHVSWDFQVVNIMVNDFEMYAESRVINYWAFVLAGLVMLALVVVLVVKGFGR
jgi:hypothetical protein